MNLRNALNIAAGKLADLKDVDNPTFEAEVLLRYLLKIDRARFYLSLHQELPFEQLSLYSEWVARRLNGEPVAYIIQNREFYCLDFQVDSRVLIPRPETELLVEQALKYINTHYVKSIADIGTGSGAIAISLAVNLKTSGSQSLPAIYAVDIAPAALELAQINARTHGVENLITFVTGDLLLALPSPVDLIIANLPYVTTSGVAAMPSAKFEPVAALDGGTDGLDCFRRLAGQLNGKLNPSGCLLLEVGQGQAPSVRAILQTIYPQSQIALLPDLAGIDRAVMAFL